MADGYNCSISRNGHKIYGKMFVDPNDNKKYCSIDDNEKKETKAYPMETECKNPQIKDKTINTGPTISASDPNEQHLTTPNATKKPAKETRIAYKEPPLKFDFPLVACATDPGMDLCEIPNLKITQSKISDNIYSISVKDCEGKQIDSGNIYADLDGDGNYETRATIGANGKATINISNATTQPVACIATQESEQEQLAGEDIDSLTDAKSFELWGTVTEETDVVSPDSYDYCAEVDYWPVAGSLKTSTNTESLKQGMIYTNTPVRFTLNEAAACDGSTGQLEYTFVVGGKKAVFTTEADPTVSDENMTAGYDDNGNPYIEVSFEIAGNYECKATVQDKGLNFIRLASTTASVIIVPAPSTDQTDPTKALPPFGISMNNVGFVGEPMPFSTDIDTAKYDVKWDFSDGKTADVAQGTHTFDQPGQKMVRLTVTDKNDPENTKYIDWYVQIYTKTTTDNCEINQNKPYILTGLTVMDNVDKVYFGDPVTFAIQVQDCDNNNSDLKVYLETVDGQLEMIDENGDGIYTITVAAEYWSTMTATVVRTTVDGEEIVAESTLYGLPTVVPQPGTGTTVEVPTPSIIADYSGTVNEPVVFIAGAPNEDKYTYTWEFGDGSTATGANPLPKTYAQTGDYTVELTVTDKNDPTNKKSITHTISIGNGTTTDEPTPIANLQVTPMYPKVGDNVVFNAAASYALANGATIVEYTLNFGDGAEETNDYGSFNHPYLASGSYTALLTVKDSNGNTETTTVDLTVYP